MRFEIRGRGVEVTDLLTERAARRLGFAVDRYGPHLASAHVLLHDRNGPRGGVDKHCDVVLRGKRGWEVRGTADSDDIGAAIDAAIERAGRAAARYLDRRGEDRHHGSAADVADVAADPRHRR